MNPYQRMHAARTAHIELARRARDYQSSLSESRAQRDAAFCVGLGYGLIGGFFLAVLLTAFASGS